MKISALVMCAAWFVMGLANDHGPNEPNFSRTWALIAFVWFRVECLIERTKP